MDSGINESLYKRLYLNKSDGENEEEGTAPKVRSIVPKPGFCIKTKLTDSKQKVFINICKGDNLPAPRQITDEELLKLLESDDPSGFRVPMSLGEPHAEIDKSGSGCTAYDVVISPEFYEVILQRPVMQGFFITVVLEGMEAKYSISLDRNWCMLKNRKFLGSLPEQNVRTQSKPWIMEMNDCSPAKNLVTEVTQPTIPKTRAVQPPYTLIQEPVDDHPQYIVAEIHLPLIKSAASLILDLGEDRILLETRSNIYHLDIYLPFDILQDDCVAQFNRATKILTVTMPVQLINSLKTK